MRGTRAALGIAAALALGAMALSGSTGSDPRTPPPLPGLPPPFLGIAVIGSGQSTGAVDAYGNLVDLRTPGPAGRAEIEIPPERQMAGTVPADSGRVARMRVGQGSIPLWRADSVEQAYLRGTNVLRTVARFEGRTATIVRSIGGPKGARADRRWIARARPLGVGAPPWARALYERSLLVLRALTDRRSGAVAAGARSCWAYVWPRDAGAVALALASAGYREQARLIVRFLLTLDLDAAARFHGDGEPVGGREAQGDAVGWVAAAAGPAGLPNPVTSTDWRGKADYQEKSPGDYLANALADPGELSATRGGATSDRRAGKGEHAARAGTEDDELASAFGTKRGLVRVAGDPASGLDSAAAWAVRPFPSPALFPAARRTLPRLAATSGRFGIVPSEDWPEDDPWTAPTAWTAWSLAALARNSARHGRGVMANRERRAALRLMDALRRAATPLGMLPERVDAQTGMPRSTTPLAWSHAFAILALRELWPGRAGI